MHIIIGGKYLKLKEMGKNKKMDVIWASDNEHIGEIAAVSPQKRQCELESYYPARTFVKPLPRQYATTLAVSAESVVDKVSRLE